jgi:type I restriction enzyme R subunit
LSQNWLLATTRASPVVACLVKSRSRSNQAQAKLFADQLDAVLHRYELRQISSAEVVQRLVEIARSLREAGRRHEQLGLTAEKAAFYDALAGGADAPNVDPQLAKIARDLVKSIREDLTVDWADRASNSGAAHQGGHQLHRSHRQRAAQAGEPRALYTPSHTTCSRPTTRRPSSPPAGRAMRSRS